MLIELITLRSSVFLKHSATIEFSLLQPAGVETTKELLNGVL